MTSLLVEVSFRGIPRFHRSRGQWFKIMHRKAGLQSVEISHGDHTLVWINLAAELIDGHCILLGFTHLPSTVIDLLNLRVCSTLLLHCPDSVAQQDLKIICTFNKHQRKWRKLQVSVRPDGKRLIKSCLARQEPVQSTFLHNRRQPATVHGGSTFSPAENPLLSVLTVNYNQTFMTDICLMAARSAVKGYTHELLCMDNGSTAAQRTLYSAFSKRVEIHMLDSNTGFAVANNAAARLAKGQYLLFLNNDAFLTENSVTELLAALHSNPRFISAAPVLLSWSGKILEAGAQLSSEARSIRRYRGQNHSVLKRKPRFENVHFVSAACLLIRRNDFMQMGGFDHHYSPAYYEDTDLCMRILTQGKINCCATKAICYHLENATSAGHLGKAELANLCELNRQRFLASWQDELSRYCCS